MTMADQACKGLDVTSGNGVVVVRDGVDTWICDETEWDRAIAALHNRGEIPGDQDEAAVSAYDILVGAVCGPIATKEGTCKGDWKPLVQRAIDAEIIESDEAIARLAMLQ